jgi:hypothetical protein
MTVCCMQVPTLLARAAGLREDLLNNGLSGHQHRAASRAVAGLKVRPSSSSHLSYSNSVDCIFTGSKLINESGSPHVSLQVSVTHLGQGKRQYKVRWKDMMPHVDRPKEPIKVCRSLHRLPCLRLPLACR